MRVSLCGWQVTRRLKGSEKEGKARKKLPLKVTSQPKGSEKEGKARKKLPLKVTWRLKGSEKEGNVTIQAPLPHIRISNTSCSFLAFGKAKNAHMGRGALLGSKCMEIKVSYVQARRFIDFHTLILNSYELLKS